MKNLVQRKTWIAMFVICVAALQAYAPAIRAGWIWDDDSYILENPAVQLPGGVLDAWVPGSTPQYYPLVFVSFWVQHAVHGLDPFGDPPRRALPRHLDLGPCPTSAARP